MKVQLGNTSMEIERLNQKLDSNNQQLNERIEQVRKDNLSICERLQDKLILVRNENLNNYEKLQDSLQEGLEKGRQEIREFVSIELRDHIRECNKQVQIGLERIGQSNETVVTQLEKLLMAIQ